MSFGRLERNAGPAPMSDINMTPLIDVMLVLLVIFIITAPLMASSLKLDLPKTDAATPSSAPASIALAIDAQGRWFVGDETLEREPFAQRVKSAGQPAARSALARRPQRAVRPGGRADRAGAAGWLDAHRLRHRGAAEVALPTMAG
jgi:biopolymer transport protein TolR